MQDLGPIEDALAAVARDEPGSVKDLIRVVRPYVVRDGAIVLEDLPPNIADALLQVARDTVDYHTPEAQAMLKLISSMKADRDPVTRAAARGLGMLAISDGIEFVQEELVKVPPLLAPSVGRDVQLPHTIGDYPTVIFEVARMKRHYRSYSLATAKKILDSLQAAHEQYQNYGAGEWTRSYIAKAAAVGEGTVSRYVKALRAEGITEYRGVPLPQRQKHE